MSKNKPNRQDMYYQGQFTPKIPEKYLGDVSDIQFRSKWEYKFCYYCDYEESVEKWSCETIEIPYNFIENEQYVTKTYIPDFWVKFKNGDEFIIEVKPYKQIVEPIPPKNSSIKSLEGYEYRLREYLKNMLKWESAEEYCKRRGLTFYLLTEKYFEDKQIKLF